jgi:integrase/recombinase XerD
MDDYQRKVPFKQAIFMPPLDPPPPAPLATVPPAQLPQRLDEHPAAVYLAQLTTKSRRTQASGLDQVAQLLGYGDALACPWQSLGYQHTAALRAALAERYAPATANRMLAAVRRVLQECWRLGLMTAEAYERAADLKVIKEEKLPSGRALDRQDVAALFAVCAADSTPAGIRDGALLAVLLATGLRRSEVVALNLADYAPSSGALTVHQGKGRKDRVVYVGAVVAVAALADYLTIRGAEPGPLFVAGRRGGHLTGRRMSDQAVALILERRAAQAGVADLSPHDLRRTFVTEMLDAGADIATVQKLAGHADPATTARYDRRGEATKQDAARLLDLPPMRRTLPLDEPGPGETG